MGIKFHTISTILLTWQPNYEKKRKEVFHPHDDNRHNYHISRNPMKLALGML
jgi:hypothetical protein